MGAQWWLQTYSIKFYDIQGVNAASYEKALATHSSPEKWITLALADQGCVDMAISFYETSLRPFPIENYLIIGSDTSTCATLAKHKVEYRLWLYI